MLFFSDLYLVKVFDLTIFEIGISYYIILYLGYRDVFFLIIIYLFLTFIDHFAAKLNNLVFYCESKHNLCKVHNDKFNVSPLN